MLTLADFSIITPAPTPPEPSEVPRELRLRVHCQWISGDPSFDDACKCGALTYGASYCTWHQSQAYRRELSNAG